MRNTPQSNDDEQRMSAISDYDRRLIRLHCDWLRRKGATADTLHHRRENLRRFAERLRCSLLDASPDALDRWQAGLTVSTSSRATYTNHVVGFYRWAVEAGHLDIDPSTRLPRPRVPRRDARPIPVGDLRVALACAPEPILIWLILAASMGLRAGEIAGIQRQDVTQVEDRWFVAGVGKWQKPFKLPVPKDTVPALLPHLQGRSGPLWRTATGRPVYSLYITNQVSAFFRGLGMPYTLHWLRHYFGTTAHRETRDLLTTMTLMRHSSPETTRIYVQQVPDEAVAVMDQIAARLRKKDTTRRRKPARPGSEERKAS